MSRPTSSSRLPYFEQHLPSMSPAISAPHHPYPTTSATTLPIVRKHKFPVPLLRLELRDLSHEGSTVFLRHVHGYEDFEAQVQNVLNLLYDKPTPEELHAAQEDGSSSSTEPGPSPASSPSRIRPGTRSVTLVLQDYSGVAETSGTDLDDDHKRVRFSTRYIAARKGDIRHELLGVLCHELVHCFQWAAGGTCNGGLIEGIADWVRLRAGLGAKHWTEPKKIGKGESWDAGYQRTGYFLEWVEGKFGEGTVRAINAGLREGEYDEKRLWGGCCKGASVEELWEEYGRDLERKFGERQEEDASNPVPTHAAGTSSG